MSYFRYFGCHHFSEYMFFGGVAIVVAMTAVCLSLVGVALLFNLGTVLEPYMMITSLIASFGLLISVVGFVVDLTRF